MHLSVRLPEAYYLAGLLQKDKMILDFFVAPIREDQSDWMVCSGIVILYLCEDRDDKAEIAFHLIAEYKMKQ